MSRLEEAKEKVLQKTVSRRSLIKWGGAVGALGVASVITGTGPRVVEHPDGKKFIGFSVGHVDSVYAGMDPDFLCDGENDFQQWRSAINALPETGGHIIALSGLFDFKDYGPVSRDIDRVHISGAGLATRFSSEGEPIFSAGTRDGWIFRDFYTGAGGLDLINASNLTLRDVWIDGVRYNIPEYDSRVTSLEEELNAMLTLKSAEGALVASGAEQDLIIVDDPGAVFLPISVLVDLSSMESGDAITLKLYARIKSGGELKIFGDEYVYTGSQVADPIKAIILLPNRYGFRVTLEQSAGTNRTFEYQYFYED